MTAGDDSGIPDEKLSSLTDPNSESSDWDKESPDSPIESEYDWSRNKTFTPEHKLVLKRKVSRAKSTRHRPPKGPSPCSYLRSTKSIFSNPSESSPTPDPSHLQPYLQPPVRPQLILSEPEDSSSQISAHTSKPTPPNKEVRSQLTLESNEPQAEHLIESSKSYTFGVEDNVGTIVAVVKVKRELLSPVIGQDLTKRPTQYRSEFLGGKGDDSKV